MGGHKYQAVEYVLFYPQGSLPDHNIGSESLALNSLKLTYFVFSESILISN